MDVGLIKCNLSDWEQLLRISRETFIDTYAQNNDPANFELYLEQAFNEAQIKKELEKRGSYFYCIKSGDKVAAYLKVNEPEAQTDLKEPGTLEIERIYVRRDFQGQGLGRRMIDFSIGFAREKNLDYIWLGVWIENPEAIAFYERMGFQNTGTHIFQVGTEAQKDYVLKLKV